MGNHIQSVAHPLFFLDLTYLSLRVSLREYGDIHMSTVQGDILQTNTLRHTAQDDVLITVAHRMQSKVVFLT